MASSGARGLVVVGLLVGLVAACSEDKPADDGKAGSAGTTTQAGSGGSASGSGGSPITAGSAGKAAGMSGSSGSTGGSGGSAGSGGKAASGEELSASTTACEPDCPESQYCALLEVDCTREPCLVSAVCKDRNKCSSSMMCPHAPMELCADDPETDCSSGDPGCMGICLCSENAMPCAPQALDRRAGVCACVDKLGDEEFCSDVDCPDNAKCVIELGKSYCVVP